MKSKPGSTDDKTLARLVKQHPVIQLIRDYRAYKTLLTRYARPMPKFVSEDGRIHSTFRFTRTETGRLSSTAPNLMAQPVRSEEGRRIREAFKAAPLCSLVSCDLSQIEMRVCAHASNDPVMIDVFVRALDLHTQTAARIFGIPVDQVDDAKHRYPCKRVGFGILYGIGPEGLHDLLTLEGLPWSVADCDKLIKEWFGIYKGVKAMMQQIRLDAMRDGYVREPIGGRIRHVPGVWADDKRIVEEALRQATNAPIQAGAQQVIKEAMGQLIPLYRTFQVEGHTFAPLIQIHDDLVFEVSDPILLPAATLIQSVMCTAVTLRVPVEADVKAGKTWGAMTKLKSPPP